MYAREERLDHMLELFESPSTSRGAILERTLSCDLPLTEADGVVVLVTNNRALERWSMRSDGAGPEAVAAPRPSSEFSRMLLKAVHPIQLVDVEQDARTLDEDACPGIEAGPALFIPLRQRQR